MSMRHTRTVELRGSDGRTYYAHQLQRMNTFKTTESTHTVGGSILWQLANGAPLNTDNDVDFSDLDGRTYRLVD